MLSLAPGPIVDPQHAWWNRFIDTLAPQLSQQSRIRGQDAELLGQGSLSQRLRWPSGPKCSCDSWASEEQKQTVQGCFFSALKRKTRNPIPLRVRLRVELGATSNVTCHKPFILLGLMAGTTRLELATSAVTGRRSNQLSYVPFSVLPRMSVSEEGRFWRLPASGNRANLASLLLQSLPLPVVETGSKTRRHGCCGSMRRSPYPRLCRAHIAKDGWQSRAASAL